MFVLVMPSFPPASGASKIPDKTKAGKARVGGNGARVFTYLGDGVPSTSLRMGITPGSTHLFHMSSILLWK